MVNIHDGDGLKTKINKINILKNVEKCSSAVTFYVSDLKDTYDAVKSFLFILK